MPAPILTAVTAGQVSTAALHNERTRFLSPQSGETMVDAWAMTWFTAGTNNFFGWWIAFIQRTSVPASIALVNAVSGQAVGVPNVTTIKPDGFKLYFKGTSASAQITINGTYTVQF